MRVAPTTFGSRLRTARKAAGLTLEQLAKKAGCTKSLLAQYENGRVAECRMALLFGICDALKVSPRWMATGVGSAAYIGGLTEAERDIVLSLRHIPPAARAHVIALAESLAASEHKEPSIVSPYPHAPKPRR